MAKEHRDNKGWKGTLFGILPTQHEGQIRESRASMEDLRKAFGALVLEPISRRTVLREARSRGQTIFEYAPESQSAEEYRKLAKHILKAR